MGSRAAKDIALWADSRAVMEAVQRGGAPSCCRCAAGCALQEGALVKQGDLLVTVDPAPYAAEVDRAEAQVAAAQARVSYTRSELDRSTRLLQESAIAQREHDERQNAPPRGRCQPARCAGRIANRTPEPVVHPGARAGGGSCRPHRSHRGNLVSAGAGAPVLTSLVSVSPIYASFDTDEQIVVKARKTWAAAPRGKVRASCCVLH